MHFEVGQRVTIRGLQWQILDCSQADLVEVVGRDRINEGLRRRFLLPLDKPVRTEPPALAWTLGLQGNSHLRWKAFHDAFRLTMAHGREHLTAIERGRLVLEPYQFEPLVKLMDLPFPRLLIADDVGLGKTAEAGLILMELMQRRRADRVLVLARAGVVPEQWQREMQDKFGLEFSVFDADQLRKLRREIPSHLNPWAYRSRIITSFDFAKQPHIMRQLSNIRWDMVIIDECHHLAARGNSASDRAELGEFIAARTEGLLLLSATPHDGSSASFASLIKLVDPYLIADADNIEHEQVAKVMVRRLKSAITKADGQRFIERRVQSISLSLTPDEVALHKQVSRYTKRLFGAVKAKAGAKKSAMMRVAFAAIVLQKRLISSPLAILNSLEARLDARKRKLAGHDEPPAPENAAEDQDQHQATASLLEETREEIAQDITELTKLVKLARTVVATADAKAQAILAFLRQRPTEKFVIFTEYRDTLNHLLSFLSANGFAGQIVTFHGGLTDKERAEAHAAFVGDPNKRIFLATDAASEAINLQENCHIILHNELPWNPNRLEQRNGRIDRYGQGVTPEIFNLTIQQSLESRILDLLNKKLETIRQQLGSVSNVAPPDAARLEEILMKASEEGDLTPAHESAVEALVQESRRETAAWRGDELLKGTAFGKHEEGHVLEILERSRQFVPPFEQVEEFVRESFQTLGGRIAATAEPGIVSLQVPSIFQRADIPAQIPRATFRRDIALGKDGRDVEFLSAGHPLVQALLRHTRGQLFERNFNSRVSYRIVADGQPGTLFTFFMRFLDGEGAVLEEWLEPVFVSLQDRVSSKSDADRARFLDPGLKVNITDPSILDREYKPKLDTMLQLARAEAERRQAEHVQMLEQRQRQMADRSIKDLMRWQDSRRAYLHRKLQATAGMQMDLFSVQQRRAIRRDTREQAELQNEVQRRLEQIERLAKVQADPVFDTLGALMIVTQEGGANRG